MRASWLKDESFDVVVDDHQLRVRRLEVADPASSATLVFLHESLGSIAVWRDFPDRLAMRLGMNAVVFDRRGYGESSASVGRRSPSYLEDEAQRLGGLLDRLGITSAVLFGHSDGGSIALLAAALFPQVVRAIATEGAHVFVEERTLHGIRTARATLRHTKLREKVMRYHGDKTDAILSAWFDTWLSPDFRNWNIESYLSRVVCPALVIQGIDDEYGTEEQVRAIAAGVSGPAESLMIPGVRHTPHREATEMVIDATARFLRLLL